MSPHRISLEQLCSLPTVFFPLVSWRGDQLAFYWDRSGRMELYVMDLATRNIRQVSHGEVPRAMRTGFTWDRADRSIVFGKDDRGNEQHDLYRIDVETGAVIQLSSDPAAEEHAIRFSPDDQWLTVLTNKRSPDVPDRPGQANLWKLRADGREYVPLTRYAFPVLGGGHWSDDGQLISFTVNEDPTKLLNRDGYVMRPDGTEVRKVLSVRPGSQDVLVAWHPDSRHVAFTSDASGQSRAGVVDIVTGELQWLSPEGAEESAARFSGNGRWLSILRNFESQVRPILYEVESGKARELRLPAGVARGAQFFDHDRKLLLQYSTDTAREGLLAYDLERDTFDTLLAPAHGSVDPSVFVEAKHVWYTSFDGKRIPALLYTPSDLAPGKRAPALVRVHGGPTEQWFRGFDPFAQFLVDRGLVVIEPNIRGSTGYGVAFRDAAIKDWGGADLEDVAAAAAYLKQLPTVDATRLVVFGNSYGGFMTLMAATKKPDLWRAAVSRVGISDLHRLWDDSKEHFRYYIRQQMGDPEADRALWRDRSAIEFADSLTAKLLMIHGLNDPRCPVNQSRMMRDSLLELGRREGVDFEYVELRDEGHGSADVAQKIRTFAILADYLERVL